jgi:hydroxypyruvate isomerase
MSRRLTRRTTLKTISLGATALALPAAGVWAGTEQAQPKGNLKQSVCRWCYGRVKLEELAAKAKEIGYRSVELIGPEDVKKIKPLGLTCAVLRSASSIPDGLNRPENHDKILKTLAGDIEFAAAEGVPNVLVMSGNRKGLADDVGLAACAAGLKRVLKLAEEKQVTVLMEGLNSAVDHKDYMYDKTAWGVQMCKAVGSPRFKLLYDIYHMQIMEGDIIRTLRTHKEYIGHYHTGGNPGRNEIDETQELNYPAICKAIVATGFTGFLAQEFIPKRDALTSLAQGFRICDV